MNTMVCVKHVPDTETRVKVAPGGQALDLSEANYVINPYDEFAVEEALRLKEELGGEVAAVTVGGEESTKTLRQALAMGADSAVLASDPAMEGAEALATAKVLASVYRKQPADLILCGKHGVGDDNQQVGSLLAQLLGIASISVVTSLSLEGSTLTCKREIEGGTEVVKADLPCVVTCQKGLNEPRYPSLKGIMQAKRKPLETLSAADLELDPASLTPAFDLREYTLPPARPEGRILEGELPDQVKELVGLLHDEAKVL